MWGGKHRQGAFSGRETTGDEARVAAARARASLPTAQLRAEALLDSVLTPLQRAQRLVSPYIDHQVGNRQFGVPTISGSVVETCPMGRVMHCIYPTSVTHLWADVAAANLLLLRASVARFDKISRRTGYF